MADGIESIIVSLYAIGMSNRDIEKQIKQVYGFDISTSTISRITDSIPDDIVAWQNRPLEPVYLIVWKDKKAFSKDMMQIYKAPTKEVEKAALEAFAMQ